jgi:hypothetical protein
MMKMKVKHAVGDIQAKAVSLAKTCTTLQFGAALLDRDNGEAHETP